MTFQFIFEHPQWFKTIKPSLQQIAEESQNQQQLEQRLIKFDILTSWDRDKKHWASRNYQTLFDVYNGQTTARVFGKMAKYILSFQNGKRNDKRKINEIPVFWSQKSQEHTFLKGEVLLLMSLMAMHLIPSQKFHLDKELRRDFHPIWDFGQIFSHEEFKTRAIMQFFIKEFGKEGCAQSQQKYNEQMTIRRLVQTRQIQQILAEKKNLPMSPVQIAKPQSTVQDYYGSLKSESANKFIGGGVLLSGCLSQQIMFANHPQLLISTLMCQKMSDNQALAFIGFRKYWRNSGYDDQTVFEGQETYQYKYDPMRRVKEYITAIDATPFPQRQVGDNPLKLTEFTKPFINRELKKAFIGFSIPETDKVIGMNWGCGMFNGTVYMKFMIQWLAASMNLKPMIYCGKNRVTAQDMQRLIGRLSKWNVGRVYDLVVKAAQMSSRRKDLLAKMEELSV